MATTTQSSETILEKEMKAFQEVELLDITPAFIKRLERENITKKVKIKYFGFIIMRKVILINIFL